MNSFRLTLLVAGLLMGVGVKAETLSADGLATALVVIDIQDFYFPGGSLPLVAPEVASANAARLIAHARDGGRLVVDVGHNASSSLGFRADVAPREDESVVMKDDVNAFLGTELQARLEAAGIRRVVLCGMQTHMCVEAAARAAHDLGYEVVVVADACATRDLTFGDTVVSAAQVHAATLATLDRTYGRVMDTTRALAILD